MGEILKSIGDFVKDTDKGLLGHSRILKQGSSIASEASKSTYYFPVLVSKTVDPDVAALIAESLEYVYMDFMKACFAMTPAIVVKGDVNLDDYLKRFHQNIGVTGNKYMLDVDWKSAALDMLESAMKPFELFPNDSVNTIVDPDYYNVNNEAVASSTGPRANAAAKEAYKAGQEEAKKKYLEMRDSLIDQLNYEIEDYKHTTKNSDRTISAYIKELDRLTKVIKSKDRGLNDQEKVIGTKDAQIVKAEKDLEKLKEEFDKYKADRDLSSVNENRWTEMRTETNRHNALEPVISFAKCRFIVKGENQSVDSMIPVGIKTVIHSANSDEYIDKLIEAMVDNRGGNITSFVRWTSGEVNSLWDMLIGTTSMKENLVGSSPLSKWFGIINERKRINKLPFASLFKKPFLPNMSMVISSYDVREIQRRTGIDIMKDMRFVNKLMKNCFLLSFVVVDEGTTYTIYDGQSEFAELPIESLKRQTDKDKSDLAKFMRAMSKSM